MDDDLVAAEPGGPREGQLPLGGDVRSDPLLAQHTHHRDVRERLRPERDLAARGSLLQRPRLRTECRLAVDDERGPELCRQRGSRDSGERQGGAVDTGAVREEAEDVLVAGALAHHTGAVAVA